MSTGTCRWIMGDSTPEHPHYCGKPTAYSNELGEDGKRYREYDTFCEEHAEKAKKMDEDDPYGDGPEGPDDTDTRDSLPPIGDPSWKVH